MSNTPSEQPGHGHGAEQMSNTPSEQPGHGHGAEDRDRHDSVSSDGASSYYDWAASMYHTAADNIQYGADVVKTEALQLQKSATEHAHEYAELAKQAVHAAAQYIPKRSSPTSDEPRRTDFYGPGDFGEEDEDMPELGAMTKPAE